MEGELWSQRDAYFGTDIGPLKEGILYMHLKYTVARGKKFLQTLTVIHRCQK